MDELATIPLVLNSEPTPDTQSPLVSIIVPCFEESRTISACLDAILANEFPLKNLEILVVDGLSTDGTRDVVARYVSRYPFIQMLDNPQKNTSSALNIGIRASRGRYILILSGHITIDNHFIQKNIDGLQSTGSDCVGGVIVTKAGAETRISELITLVLSSRFAVGNSYFRVGVDKPRPVDTVPYGCYHRRVFRDQNLFNEKLIRNQDLEFNLRIKKKGGNIVLLPHIKSYYFAPSTLRAFLRQNYRNGYWVIKSLQFARDCFSARHLVPFLFVTSIIGSLLLSLVVPLFAWSFYTILTLYVVVNFYFSVKLALKSRIGRLPAYMLLFLFVHSAYGMGSASGALSLLWFKLKGQTIND